jgi:uncharacterized protein
LIDLVVFPFTPETKSDPYQHTPSLREPLVALGVWDREFTAESLLDAMDHAGVEAALISAQAGSTWQISCEYICELISACPGRLYGMAGIDPRDISGGLRRLVAAVDDLKFVGAHSYPHWFHRAPDDRSYWPFYAKCVELDVPIQIQVGQAQAGLPSLGRPGTIDAIALDFPDLKIVAIHTGYPWEREMVAVARKHENVFIGADTLHPSAWAPELVEFIRGAGRAKVMFGTSFPILTFEDALQGLEQLEFESETRELLVRGNVKRVYRIPG